MPELSATPGSRSRSLKKRTTVAVVATVPPMSPVKPRAKRSIVSGRKGIATGEAPSMATASVIAVAWVTRRTTRIQAQVTSSKTPRSSPRPRSCSTTSHSPSPVRAGMSSFDGLNLGTWGRWIRCVAPSGVAEGDGASSCAGSTVTRCPLRARPVRRCTTPLLRPR